MKHSSKGNDYITSDLESLNETLVSHLEIWRKFFEGFMRKIFWLLGKIHVENYSRKPTTNA